jgi:hypothetical protein
MRYRTSRSSLVASLGHLSEEGESCVGVEPIDAEVVETVWASCAYFGVQLSWHGGKPTQAVPGHRINCSLWGSTLQRTRHPACCLAGPGWMGPTPVGDNPTESVKTICRHADPLDQQRFVEGCIEAGFDRGLLRGSINRS